MHYPEIKLENCIYVCGNICTCCDGGDGNGDDVESPLFQFRCLNWGTRLPSHQTLTRRSVCRLGEMGDGRQANSSSSLLFSPSLKHSQIGDVGTQHLAAILPRLPGLRKLE